LPKKSIKNIPCLKVCLWWLISQGAL